MGCKAERFPSRHASKAYNLCKNPRISNAPTRNSIFLPFGRFFLHLFFFLFVFVCGGFYDPTFLKSSNAVMLNHFALSVYNAHWIKMPTLFSLRPANVKALALTVANTSHSWWHIARENPLEFRSANVSEKNSKQTKQPKTNHNAKQQAENTFTF